jgi:hypothetical protein
MPSRSGRAGRQTSPYRRGVSSTSLRQKSVRPSAQQIADREVGERGWVISGIFESRSTVTRAHVGTFPTLVDNTAVAGGRHL